MSRERSDRVVRRFALVTLVLPAMVTVVGLVIQFAVLPHAPARIVVYWDGSRTVIGGASGWLPVVLTVALGFGLPSVIGLASLPSLRRGDRSPGFRLFGAQALGISVLLTVVATGVLLQSLGSTSPGKSVLWLPVLAGLAAGVAAAVAGWFLQPKVSGLPRARAVVPLELASSERVAWMRTTFLPVPAIAVICAVVTILGFKAGFGWAAGDRDGIAAILTGVALLLIGLLVTTAVFRVRVDADGLSVRSALGIPRFRVETKDVGSVTVVDARSLGVPGSWGIRILPGRVTIVMRSTTGIRVTRRDGRIFFVTVDDAATAAAVLETYANKTATKTSD